MTAEKLAGNKGESWMRIKNHDRKVISMKCLVIILLIVGICCCKKN